MDISVVRVGLSVMVCTLVALTQPTSDMPDRYICDSMAEEILKEIRLTREMCSVGIGRPSTGCPADFTYLSAANKCYRLITDKLSWDGARLRCKSLHSMSHSVVVNDQSEQEAIVGLFQSIDAIVINQCYQAPWAAIWTAGQRIDFPGNTPFLWKPDNATWKPMPYTHWNAGEPNNYGGAENCVHFLGYPSYTWNDFSCDEKASYTGISGDMCVLCEIDME